MATRHQHHQQQQHQQDSDHNVSDGSFVISNDNSLNMLIEQSDNLLLSSNPQQAELENNQTPPPMSQHQQHSLVSPASGAGGSSGTVSYVNAPHGLFPIPLSKTAKTSQISRLKYKFKFLGKFMAKAVMDSRMVSLWSASQKVARFEDSNTCILSTSSLIYRTRYRSIGGC